MQFLQSLVKVFCKTFCFKLNRNHFDRAMKRAPKNAYHRTSKKIKQAKKNHRHINASAEYKRQLVNVKRTERNRREDIDHLISSI